MHGVEHWTSARAAILVGAVVGTSCGPSLGSTGSSTDGGPLETDTGTPPVCASRLGPGEDPLDWAAGCEIFDHTLKDRAHEPFADEVLPTVEIRFVNATSHTILIHNRHDGCAPAARYFDAEGTAGGRRLFTPGMTCPTYYDACRSWRDPELECSTCLRIFAPLCLHPGEVKVQPWHAWLAADTVLPASCNLVGDEAQPCHQEVPLVPGHYRLWTEATVIENCHCVDEMRCPFDEPKFVGSTEYDGECGEAEIVISD